MNQPDDKVWNGLFWMMQLFICVNAVAKSFLQESGARLLYYYTIAGPVDFIIARLVFNTLLMVVMSIVSLLLFQLLLGDPLQHAAVFFGIACLGGCSIGLVFTFLAAIAARARQNAAMMAILGFPLIIPQLLLLMRISNAAFADVLQPGFGKMILALAGLDVLVIALSVILFSFLWKD